MFLSLYACYTLSGMWVRTDYSVGVHTRLCIKYSFDSRAHLKTERRLCFPTSDRLETWLLSSERQYHESTMV